MAAKGKKKKDKHFAKLGKRGGAATRDSHGSDHYRKIAELSHESRRQRKLAAQNKDA